MYLNQKWELVIDQDNDAPEGMLGDLATLHRLKVPGGWLVKNTHIALDTKTFEHDEDAHQDIISTSLAFLPDINHSWVITEEIEKISFPELKQLKKLIIKSEVQELTKSEKELFDKLYKKKNG